MECAHINKGFGKTLQGKDTTYNLELNTKLRATFGSTREAHAFSSALDIKIEKVEIHPDYWEDKMSRGQSHDVALIRTNKVGWYIANIPMRPVEFCLGCV